MHEGVAQRAVHDLAELRARDQLRVDVDAVGVEREVAELDLPIVHRHEHQVDVRFGPDDVVGEAAAQQRRENGAVGPCLFNERVERRRVALLDRRCHA